MEKFSLIIPQNASTEEVTDTVADLFEIGYTVEDTLEDGFQLTDVLAAIQLEPVVREVVNDFPVFLEQFQSLRGATAVAALKAAKERTESKFGDLGRIGGFIYGFLGRSAATFEFIEGVVIQGVREIDEWKALFATLKKPVA